MSAYPLLPLTFEHRSPRPRERHFEFVRELNNAASKSDMFPLESRSDELPVKLEKDVRIDSMRRGIRLSRSEDPVRMLTLLEQEDGVFVWAENVIPRPTLAQEGARRAAFGLFREVQKGAVVTQFKFESLESNKVGDFLWKLDTQLTPLPHGLKRWDGSTLRDLALTTGKKRILLFVHGTFSKSHNLFDQLVGFEEGREFLASALNRYDEILAFDHPTLSVSPVLNALDLARALAGSSAEIDVICHSRGGLVTRWWIECFGGARHARKVIFVGSPLAGTSLAAPPKLRGALNLLTNVAQIVSHITSAASTTAPFLIVATGLLRVVSSVTSIAAKSPILDAAVAMVPGFSCQSQVSNNFELLRLRSGVAERVPQYYAVTANFEAASAGWKFWRYFVGLGRRMEDVGADLVFRQPNDLVVDTSSMTQLFGMPILQDTRSDSDHNVTIAPERVLDFGTTERVFHTNYFQQRETTKFFADSLLR